MNKLFASREIIHNKDTVIKVNGARWGDEAKAKNGLGIAEFISGYRVTGESMKNHKVVSLPLLSGVVPENTLVCIRSNGGSNAGHTNVVPTSLTDPTPITIKSVQVPCGMLIPGTIGIIGCGCVVNIGLLEEEICQLEALGISDIRQRLLISHNAQVVTQGCITEDREREEARKKTNNSIGTTCQGIGPAYAHKAYRDGIRVEDMKEDFNKLGVVCDVADFFIRNLDTPKFLLFEGAQAMKLDIDWGAYPCVTSSNTMPYGVYSTGCGEYAANTIVVLSAKLYDTYVGNDLFQPDIVEQQIANPDTPRHTIVQQYTDIYKADPEKASHRSVFAAIQHVGREFGTRTGRLRQVNYLNLTNILRDIHFARPANGKVVFIVNKCDVQQEVYNKYPEFRNSVYGLIDGDTTFYSSFEELKAAIISKLVSVKIHPDDIHFTETPYTNPEMWGSMN